MANYISLVLDVEKIRELAHYYHWIPITRGYHHEYVRETYPGWSWMDLLPRLMNAGYVFPRGKYENEQKLRQGLSLAGGITAIEFRRSPNGKVRLIIQLLEETTEEVCNS